MAKGSTATAAAPVQRTSRVKRTPQQLAGTHMTRALRALRNLGQISGLTEAQRQAATDRLDKAYNDLEAAWAGAGALEFSFEDNAG